MLWLCSKSIATTMFRDATAAEADLFSCRWSCVTNRFKEDDREDAARLKALHLAWQAQSDDLEKL